MPSIKGIGQVLGGLVNGKPPDPGAVLPEAQVILIVPDVGDKADILFGTPRAIDPQRFELSLPPVRKRKKSRSSLKAARRSAPNERRLSGQQAARRVVGRRQALRLLPRLAANRRRSFPK